MIDGQFFWTCAGCLGAIGGFRTEESAARSFNYHAKVCQQVNAESAAAHLQKAAQILLGKRPDLV